MARLSTATTISKAQVPISCHFCNENKTKWKCAECDILMCNSCKDRIHERIKSTKDREVLTFYNIGKHQYVPMAVSSEVISSILNSYTTSVPVSNLLCSNYDIVYILANKGQEKLIKGKMLKESIKALVTLDEPIFDIAVNKKGEVLFTQLLRVPESPIRTLLKSGQVKTVLDPKPMRLLDLHFNMDDELVCSLCEQGSPFPLHDFSVRQVVIFGSDYKNLSLTSREENCLHTQLESVLTPKMEFISLIGQRVK